MRGLFGGQEFVIDAAFHGFLSGEDGQRHKIPLLLPSLLGDFVRLLPFYDGLDLSRGNSIEKEVGRLHFEARQVAFAENDGRHIPQCRVYVREVVDVRARYAGIDKNLSHFEVVTRESVEPLRRSLIEDLRRGVLSPDDEAPLLCVENLRIGVGVRRPNVVADKASHRLEQAIPLRIADVFVFRIDLTVGFVAFTRISVGLDQNLSDFAFLITVQGVTKL